MDKTYPKLALAFSLFFLFFQNLFAGISTSYPTNHNFFSPEVSVQKLRLTSMCSENPDATRRWRITNPNEFEVKVAWIVYGTSQQDTIMAPAGISYFETNTIGGANTTLIRWYDGKKWKQTVKASSGVKCEVKTVTNLVLEGQQIEENQPSGTVVGTFNRGDGYNGWLFLLVEGEGAEHNEFFYIDGHTLYTNAPLNHEVINQASIKVRGENPGGKNIVEQVFEIQVLDINEPPLWISLSSNRIDEFNSADDVVGLVYAEDPDESDELTFELVDVTDETPFAIQSDKNLIATEMLFFAEKPSYDLVIRAIDSNGSSIDSVFTININNIPTTPENLSLDNTSIDEHLPVGSLIANLDVSNINPFDEHQFELVEGEGDIFNDFFSITGNQLFTNEFIDYHQNIQLSLRIRVSDKGGDYMEKAFTIDVQNVVNPPSNIGITNHEVFEFEPAGSLIGKLSATDPDTLENHAFSFVSGAGSTDNALFSIEGSHLFSNEIFYFTQKSQYSIRVKVTDIDGATFEKIISIDVKDVLDLPSAPKLSKSDIDEQLPIGSLVSTLNTEDINPFDSHTYELIDTGNFIIEGNQLKTTRVFNYQEEKSFSIRVRVTDLAGDQAESEFNIVVNNIINPPTDIELPDHEIFEFEPAGSLIGEFAAVDPDMLDTHSFILVDGTGSTDNEIFSVENSKLFSNEAFCFAQKAQYSIRVKVTDIDGASFEKAVSIDVKDVPDPPSSPVISKLDIDEYLPVGSLVGILSTEDINPFDSHTYELIDTESFIIEGNQLKTTRVFNYQEEKNFSIRVRVTDLAGDQAESEFNVVVNNIINPPTDIQLSNHEIFEFEPAGSLIGEFSTVDPDTFDTHSFSLVDGTGSADNALFSVEGSKLFSNEAFCYTKKSQYSLRVRVTDVDGATFEEAVNIEVKDVPDPPSSPLLSKLDIDEHLPAGFLVGKLSTNDINPFDSHIYELVNSDESQDTESFVIEGNQLKTAQIFNYQEKTEFTIRIKITDAAGDQAESKFSIVVNNIVNPPTGLELSNTSIEEFSNGKTYVAEIIGFDPDSLEELRYSLIEGGGGEDNALFEVSGDSLFGLEYFNYRIKSEYNILLQTLDTDSTAFKKAFVIKVTDLADPPFNLTIDTSFVFENEPVGTKIGIFSSQDLDSLDNHTYHLINSVQANDNAFFYISGDTLFSASVFDFNAKSSYSIYAEVRDETGSKIQKSMSIEVLDKRIPPENLELTLNHLVYEQTDIVQALGTLSTNDPDQTSGHIYQLISGEGSTDNASFRIEDDQLYSNIVFVYDIQKQYAIRIKVTDEDNLSFEKSIFIDIEPIDQGGTGDYTQIENQLPFSFTSTVSLGDFDQDGDNDLFIGNKYVPSEVFWNDGYGKFESSDTIFGRSNIYASYVVDIDHDSDLDIIAANWHNPSLIWLNDGTGNFTSVDPGFSIGSILNLPIADFDNDGDLDIIEVVYGKENLIWWNDGHGNFTKGHSVASPYTYTLIHGDYDGDGDIDLYEVRHEDIHHVWMNEGNGVFIEKIGATPNDLPVFDATVVDIDMDGDMDLLMPSTYGPNLIALNDGNGVFTQGIEVMGNKKTHHIAAGDLNDDGYPDVMVANSKMPCEVYLNDGAGNLILHHDDIGLGDSRRIALGKLDPDNDLDAAIGNHNTSNTIWLNESKPAGILLSNYQLLENAEKHSFVATLSTFDPDAAETHTYQLVEGDGNEGNQFFTLSGDSLFTQISFDYEKAATHSIRIRTTDKVGLSHEQQVIIRIKDIDETPVMDAIADQKIDFNGIKTVSITGIDVPNAPSTPLSLTVSVQNASFIDSARIEFDGYSNTANLYLSAAAYEFGSTLVSVQLKDTSNVHQISQQFIVEILEPTITTTGVAFCMPDTLTVSADGAYDFYWYGDLNSQVPIFQGNTYSKFFDKSDTLYTSAISAFGNESATRTPVTVEIYEVPTLIIEGNQHILTTNSTFSEYRWYINDEAIDGATGWEYEALVNGIYSVMAITNNGCEAISGEYVIDDFETATLEEDGIVIEYYPNPTSDNLTVSLTTSAIDQTSVMILDSSGALVLEIHPINEILLVDVSQLLTGVYFLKVVQPEGIGVEKFLKN